MAKKKEISILVFLLLVLFILNYNFLDKALTNFLDESEIVFVTRVIDGDTVEAGNYTIRLLGINSPERGEEYYEEAKEYLEELVLHKSVKIEFGNDREDKYERLLAYLIVPEKNVNSQLIRKGFANYYFPSGKDKYYGGFVEVWKECLNENKNLCEKSLDECSNCIILKELDYKKEIVTFENDCNFDCNLNEWMIKDEGRKEFYFRGFVLESGQEVLIITGEGENTDRELFWKDYDYVWTDSGDTLFLRDSKGKLVLWKSY